MDFQFFSNFEGHTLRPGIWMLFGGYIFLYKIQTYIHCLFACAILALPVYRGNWKGQGTHAPTGALLALRVYRIYKYIVFIYNMCIYTPFYIICIKNWLLFLKTRFGPYLLFTVGFGAPFPYNSIFELWIFNLFSNF